MKNKIILLAFALMLFAGIVSASSINGDYKGNPIVKVTSNGKLLETEEVPAQIYDGHTLVPISLLRQIGASVTWDANAYSVDVKITAQNGTDNTITDFKNVVESTKRNLKEKTGIDLATLVVSTDEKGVFVHAIYKPDGVNGEQMANNISIICIAALLLEKYNVSGLIVETRDGNTPTGTVSIQFKDIKDFSTGKISYNDFLLKWTAKSFKK